MIDYLKSLIKYFIKETIAVVMFIPSVIFLKYAGVKQQLLIVLNYHNFSKYNNYKIKRGAVLETGYAGNFEKQIKFLNRYFKFVYPEVFFKNETQNALNVLITFDDGYKDNVTIASPILEAYNAKAVFFVVTDYIGTKQWLWHDKVRYLAIANKIDGIEAEHTLKMMNAGQTVAQTYRNKIEELFKQCHTQGLMMTWDDVKRLKNSGFKIGAHTANHEILQFLTRNEQHKEIRLSVNKVNEILNEGSNVFAYPNGLFNEDTLEILQEHKINYGFTTVAGLNTIEENKLQIKRLGINASDSVFVLLLKIMLEFRK